MLYAIVYDINFIVLRIISDHNCKLSVISLFLWVFFLENIFKIRNTGLYKKNRTSYQNINLP